MTKLCCLACALALSLSSSSSAQTLAVDEPAPTVRYRAKTEIVISDEQITGHVEKPGWTVIKGRKKPTFRNLIELRSNFRPELSSSKDGL